MAANPLVYLFLGVALVLGPAFWAVAGDDIRPAKSASGNFATVGSTQNDCNKRSVDVVGGMQLGCASGQSGKRRQMAGGAVFMSH